MCRLASSSSSPNYSQPLFSPCSNILHVPEAPTFEAPLVWKGHLHFAALLCERYDPQPCPILPLSTEPSISLPADYSEARLLAREAI